MQISVDSFVPVPEVAFERLDFVYFVVALLFFGGGGYLHCPEVDHVRLTGR